MTWCTKSTTTVYRNTLKHTQGFTMGTWSRAHCTYNSECNMLFILGSPPFIFCCFFHLSVISTHFCPIYPFSPSKLHGSLDVSLEEMFPFFHFSIYKHDMYRNSTQTNMFPNTTFLKFLNSPHEPATHVHNAFIFKSITALFSFFFIHKSTSWQVGLHVLFLCARCPVPCLWDGFMCVWSCMAFTCCTERLWSQLLFTLKIAACEVKGRGCSRSCTCYFSFMKLQVKYDSSLMVVKNEFL